MHNFAKLDKLVEFPLNLITKTISLLFNLDLV